MIKSKAWNWDIASAPQWQQPAGEVYPLMYRWQQLGFKRLLDLGCGVGRHSFLFAQNGFKVEAFDFGKEGVEETKKIAERESLPIKTTVGDMLSLPYENDAFDCLISYHTIYHADDEGIKKAISEVKRVLKRGGEAYLTFNSQNSTAFKNPLNQHLSSHTVFKNQGHEAGIPHYYATKEDVDNLLKDFEVIEFTYKEEYDPDYTGAHYHVLIKKK